jgi:hypothetical protein
MNINPTSRSRRFTPGPPPSPDEDRDTIGTPATRRNRRLSTGEYSALSRDKSGYLRRHKTEPDGRVVWVMEHRRVAEETLLKRALTRDERVGFADGNRGNCDPDNLVISTTLRPRTQTRDDVTTYAVSMLQRYAPHLLASAPTPAPTPPPVWDRTTAAPPEDPEEFDRWMAEGN